jgi:hypothetical protein
MATSKTDKWLREILEHLLLSRDHLKIYKNPPSSLIELKPFAWLIAKDQTQIKKYSIWSYPNHCR